MALSPGLTGALRGRGILLQGLTSSTSWLTVTVDGSGSVASNGPVASPGLHFDDPSRDALGDLSMDLQGGFTLIWAWMRPGSIPRA